ncbi:uncharacterized protein isoform X2 [Leptinotarsa decemlineata]|uniref:uncharacterized protein isoform X2 n=1 Tax=Leptinotarsa decemlineata TaxID=7539 RepID=UPI003D30982D
MDLPETYVPGFHYENAVRRMKYNKLGDTGINVSEISLGTAGFCYFYGNYDIEECRKTVHEAIKNGINFIDTGPWYGHGVAEEILGKCLKGVPRKAYYIGTKVGRYEKDPELMFDFSMKKTKESIDISLKKLGIDYVDILQIHDIEFAPSLDFIFNETLPAVVDIVRAGKARFIGITGYPVSTLLEFIQKSSVQIHTILSYCRLTMIDDTLKSFIPELEENDIELGKLAVYYSLQQEGPATVLVGMNSMKLLECNLDVVLNGLSERERDVYEKVLKIFAKLTTKHWEN